MTEERKYAILFAATILAARKLAEVGARPCPASAACIADAITKAELILRKIEQRFGEREIDNHIADRTNEKALAHAKGPRGL